MDLWLLEAEYFCCLWNGGCILVSWGLRRKLFFFQLTLPGSTYLPDYKAKGMSVCVCCVCVLHECVCCVSVCYMSKYVCECEHVWQWIGVGWQGVFLPRSLDGGKCAEKSMSSSPGTRRWPYALLTQMVCLCAVLAAPGGRKCSQVPARCSGRRGEEGRRFASSSV